MDDFARLPREERRVYFEQTAARLGLSAQMIEKDFWVCWTLRRLFSLPKFYDQLTFKGGTTLSKVYRIIERFSEDLDISIEKGFLGFGGENEPEQAPSKKQRNRRIEELRNACRTAVAEQLQPQLHRATTLALDSEAGWSLSLDPADTDGQSLLFHYPPAITGSLSPYFAAAVKIELGGRSDHFPIEKQIVVPYISDAFPDALTDPNVQVRVLAAARTFWEKTTILHRLFHQRENMPIPPRMSRHYYDVFKLSQSEVWSEVFASLPLLDRVVEQTIIYSPRPWAQYDEVLTGKLRLNPPERITDLLKKDYREMQPMFFREPPPFDDILTHLAKLENRINENKR